MFILLLYRSECFRGSKSRIGGSKSKSKIMSKIGIWGQTRYSGSMPTTGLRLNVKR